MAAGAIYGAPVHTPVNLTLLDAVTHDDAVSLLAAILSAPTTTVPAGGAVSLPAAQAPPAGTPLGDTMSRFDIVSLLGQLWYLLQIACVGTLLIAGMYGAYALLTGNRAKLSRSHSAIGGVVVLLLLVIVASIAGSWVASR